MAVRTESNATNNANGETNAGTCERPKSSWALIVLAWLAAVVALYLARDVIIPVVLAVLLQPSCCGPSSGGYSGGNSRMFSPVFSSFSL